MNYNLHQTIHELIPQINQTYGLELKIKGKKYIGINNMSGLLDYDYLNIDNFSTNPNIDLDCIAIEQDQIRQILFGLRELLGKTGKKFFLPKSQAQALDNRWFRPTEKDGEYTGQSMFDKNPDQVLEELIEILKELLK